MARSGFGISAIFASTCVRQLHLDQPASSYVRQGPAVGLSGVSVVKVGQEETGDNQGHRNQRDQLTL